MHEEICDTMPVDEIPLTQMMIHHLFEGLINNGEIERAIFLYRDIRAREIELRPHTYSYLISSCVEYNEAEEAFAMLTHAVEVWSGHTVMDHLKWLVLESCARKGFVCPQWWADCSWREHYIAGNISRRFRMLLFRRGYVYLSSPSQGDMAIPHLPRQYFPHYRAWESSIAHIISSP
jgi:hypothetical protein